MPLLWKAGLPPNDRHTYGYHRLQVLAAPANGSTLLLVAFEIFREACQFECESSTQGAVVCTINNWNETRHHE